jgi:hypothetical protein
MGHRLRLLIAVCLAIVLGNAARSLAVNNASFTAAMESITADELYQYVEVLADDVYEGRAAGSRGGRAAAQYIVKQLRPFNLKPAGAGDDYYQPFSNDCRNILLLQPGDDPQLTNEVIVVGAHYDHVGYGNRNNSYGPYGKIHNGADDNASGTSVLLETIEAFARSGLKTRRTILFAFWDGEERGLVGSKYWISHPTVALERVKLDITLDMVGRLRDQRLYLMGSRSAYGMRRLFSGPVEEPMWLDFSWELSANSDHWPFMERQIPIALLHTGMHSDYHRPSDDADKINRAGLREVCRYLLAALVKVANEDRLPKFRDEVRRESESSRRHMEEPLPKASLASWPTNQPPPRLGISWREDDAEPGSVFVVRVVDGTPAATAGFTFGDRIDELDGRPFDDAVVFQREIQSLLESGRAEFSMLIERRGHMRTLNVQLRATVGDTKPNDGKASGGAP